MQTKAKIRFEGQVTPVTVEYTYDGDSEVEIYSVYGIDDIELIEFLDKDTLEIIETKIFEDHD